VPTLTSTRIGSGQPLVLLHALGLSRSAWDPVVPALSQHFDVIAVDLPGFGASAPLPPHVEPTPATLAEAVAALLAELGVTTAHVAGNSLGGWVALELAALTPVASLTLLAPAGLWRDETPLYCRASLRATRWLARHGGRPLAGLVGTRLGRALVFAQSVGHPTRLAPDSAVTSVHEIGESPGFDAVFDATLHRRYSRTLPIDAPVTVAFGSRDHVLLKRQSRHLDELPAHTTVVELSGCGHLPMSDDPAAVSELILSTARKAACCRLPRLLRPGQRATHSAS
jgi:pimeloyl-ACP methyl ester carboxylesterase